MIKREFIVVLIVIFKLSGFTLVKAQEQTVGLFLNEPGAYEGYTLFAPLQYTTTYLINNEGRLIHSWEGEYTPGNSVYFLENGNLLRTCNVGNPKFTSGGTGGLVQEIDWDGNVVWDFRYSSASHCQHHDIEYLPNGNVLMIAWEFKTQQEAILAGRNPALVTSSGLWPDHIIEVQLDGLNSGTIVWEWHVWDHLIQDYDSTKANYGVVTYHPELIDINYATCGDAADWNHTNGIDYNEEFNQIIVSVRTFSEMWVIDHSTTTEEAAGHTGGNSGKGGDLLYRWGNPQAYGRGGSSDQRLFKQHDAQWIPTGCLGEGNILVFNNGEGRPDGNFSSVDEIIPPVDGMGNYGLIPGSAYGPSEPVWVYTDANPFDFYASFISGAQRLPNGNTIICNGPIGTFFEVTPGKEMVWKYVNPVIDTGPLTQGDSIPGDQHSSKNSVFRAYRYPTDYPGFVGKDLTPGEYIERYPSSIGENLCSTAGKFILHQNHPNPFNASTIFSYYLSVTSYVQLKVYNTLGREVRTLVDKTNSAGRQEVIWDGKNDRGQDVSSGVYYYKLQIDANVETRKMILIR
jgi:hypothetical protein